MELNGPEAESGLPCRRSLYFETWHQDRVAEDWSGTMLLRLSLGVLRSIFLTTQRVTDPDDAC